MKQDLLDEAHADLQAKRNAHAVSKFRQVLAQDPQNAFAYQGLAQALAGLHRYREACSACRRALDLDPNLAIPHEILAIAFAVQKRYPESHAEIDNAIRLNPNAASAFVTLGFLHSREGRLQEAEESFKQAIRIDPDNSRAHYNLAITYSREKRKAESLHEARTAWRLVPSLDTGRMVAFAFIGRYQLVLFLLLSLAVSSQLSRGSLFALPISAIMLAVFLVTATGRFRAGDRSGAARSSLLALFWIGLYIYTQVL